MSISNKHKFKTFTNSSPASLLHCIENILNHSSGKCSDSLTMAAVSYNKSTGLCSISSKKEDTDTTFDFSTRTSLWYSERLRQLDN